MSEDIAERLRDIADELESGDGDFPEVNGYQMVKEAGPFHTGYNFYIDADGDLWITDENDEAASCGPNFLTSREVKGLWDAVK